MTSPPQLDLPARSAPRRDEFDWHPRAIGTWIAGLPVANLAATGPQVSRALGRLNRWVLPAAERLAALERFLPLVDYLVQALRRHCLGRPLPLRRNAAGASRLARQLLAEAALGHEIAATEVGGGLRRRRRLALALEHALRLRGRELLEHWLAYEPPRAGLWARLHGVFALAEAEGVAAVRVRASDGSGASPAEAYKQILLCAAIGPHRLGQHEIPEIWELLGRLADSAGLDDAGAEDDGSEAVYRVPRHADAPPHAAVPALNRPDDRVLLTTPLLQRLEASLHGTGALTRLDPELSGRVALALGAVPRRRHRRLRAQARAEVQAGFRQVHDTLCERLGRRADAAERERSRFQAATPRAERAAGRDVWSLLYPNELLASLRAADEAPDSGAPAAPAGHVEEDIWQLVNISASGYCLLAGDDRPRRLAVGELLLLRELAGRALPMQLGAVRWLRADAESGLEVGIEMLGSDPVPLELRAEHEDGHFGPVERALLLPRAESRDQPPTLLAPGRHFVAGRRVRLRHGDRETELDLLRERDGTAHYVQLEFRRHSDATDDDGVATLFDG